MRQKLAITIRGNHHTWGFRFDGDPKYLQEWRDDGLVVDEVINTIPIWLPSWAMRPWIFVQDLFHFRNPFAN